MLSLDLWRADAVVLHFWLTSVDLDTLPYEHAGQKQALRDLLTELDQTIAAQADDEEIVRSHELVDRTGTVIDPARIAPRPQSRAAAAAPSVPAGPDPDDEYGLAPF